MEIVDTHCHVIDRTRLRYPWLAEVPALDRDFAWTEYRQQAQASGIGRVMHMEVDVAPEDAAAEVAMARAFDPAGIVAGCRPEHDDFPRDLERLGPEVKGLRRVLHTMPDALSQTPPFAANIRRLAPLGLTFDLCVLARQLPLATALARACPDTVFVLDHCGNPPIAAGELGPWRDALRELGALANVNCKLSGIVTQADPARWSVHELRPVFEHVVAVFGAARIVWGSDWPVCTLAADLGVWVEATHRLLEGASPDEQAAIWGGNAARIYRLEQEVHP